MEHGNYKLSRRGFLRWAGLAAGAAVFSACKSPTSAPEVREVTKVVAGTPVVEVVTVTPAPVKQPDKIAIWSPGDNGTVADWNYDPILAVVEEATNTEIEMLKIDWSTFVDQVNAAAASGNLPDVIGCVNHQNRALLEGWVRDGVIAPFEDSVAEAAPYVLAQYEKNPSLNELRINGRIYFQPISWGDGNYPNMGLLHVRKDLLDKLGLEPPDTLDQYSAFVSSAMAKGEKGILFGGSGGIGPAINAFAGAFGLPFRGWVKTGNGFGYCAVQPAMKEALVLFRQMVAEGLVDPASWESGANQRDLYVAGRGCALIFNGGGHTGRIQNDMALKDPAFKNWLLPAPSAGGSNRGYTAEEMFWGVSSIGGMKNNNPVAAARVINFLISPEGYELTAVGIEGRDFERVGGEIKLLEQRTKDGFPTEAGNTGAHPLATTIVSWVPQEWQDWALLYGKDEAYKSWYKQMWQNQGKYQIQTYGLLTTSPAWTQFYSTSQELITRSFLAIVQSGSDSEAMSLFDQFLNDWHAAGGTAAQDEMSAVLKELYPS